MTFQNKKKRYCEECFEDIEIDEEVHLKNDILFVCKKCSVDNYKNS